jgi:hypothetical protein
MIPRVGLLLLIPVVFALVICGCSGETVVPTENQQNNTSGLVTGDISEAAGSFEYKTETAGNPSNPIQGPFGVRGTNIHYVDSLSVLSVDFTVVNYCRCDFHEPIGLTFVNLLPAGVTVENPDNDEHGPGAQIIFEFENDDGMWTAGEQSLPRTVLFGVDSGVSIGFVARIDIGMDDTRGSIGGVVWNDVNENGMIDTEEPGIGGVEIVMQRTDGPETSVAEILWRTITARDGSFRFDGLDAGHYEVQRTPNPKLLPTTPTTVHVILVEEDGQVSDFLMANFGCVPTEPVRPLIKIGDYVQVTGKYDDSGADGGTFHRVEGTLVEVIPCNGVIPRPDGTLSPTAGDDWERIQPCSGLKGDLCGPVTAVDRENKSLAVMGTTVSFDVSLDTIPSDSTFYADLGNDVTPECRCVDFDDVEVGDRVCVRVLRVHDREGNLLLIGLRIAEWDGEYERVSGRVDRILERLDGRIELIQVLRTTVLISEDTVIKLPR